MSSLNEIVDQFDVGFFSIHNNNKKPIDFDINEDNELPNFRKTLTVVSSEACEPPPLETRYLDGFDYSDPKNPVPIQIPITGHFMVSFLDEDGNWDEEAEFESYRQKESEYKEKVINEWLQNMSYDLSSKSELMKALLAKVE